MAQHLIDTAHDLAERGWYVFPLFGKQPGRNCARCSVDGTGTCPGAAECRDSCGRWCHNAYSATTDPIKIETLWPERADGLAIATGPSGLFVVDVDADGMPWAREQWGGLLPATRTYRSRSGSGVHLYYRRADDRITERNLRRTTLAVDVDVKAASGYVRWTGNVVDDQEPAEAPEGFITTVLEASRPVNEAAPRDAMRREIGSSSCPTWDLADDGGRVRRHRSPRFMEAGLAAACSKIRNAQPGVKQDTAYRVVRGFASVHGCCATEAEWDALAAACEANGIRWRVDWRARFTAA